MNGRNEENLKGLFEQFLIAEEAKQAVEDVVKGEQILGEHAAPEPDEELIADIKTEITARLLHRRADVFRKTAYRAAVAAAAVIIMAAIGVKLFEKDNGESGEVMYASIIPRAIWESDDIAADDVDLAILTAEVEQIEDEVLTLQLGEDGGNGDRAVTELEMELIEINIDFWKG